MPTLSQRIFKNFWLKFISLAAAVLISIYVQQEQDPVARRTILAEVIYKNQPKNTEIVTEDLRLEVIVSGTLAVVEALKDNDIKATADLTELDAEKGSTSVRLNYSLPVSVKGVTLEPRNQFIKIQLYRTITRKMQVTVIFDREAPAGLRYQEPVVSPTQVEVTGREDRVARVEKLLALPQPTIAKSSIAGSFPIFPQDSKSNVVEGITIKPDRVRISITQIPDNYTKTVSVSAMIVDRPLPPYLFNGAATMPLQVRISGSPRRINTVSTIETEDLSIRNLTANAEIRANLVIPPDVSVEDMQGQPINMVGVKIFIRALPSLPTDPSNPPSSGGKSTGSPTPVTKNVPPNSAGGKSPPSE